MVAYFSSKFTKQIHAAISATLLVLCLLGTHWVGLSHSVAHAGFQNQSTEAISTSAIDKSLSHSSEACHLFDALSLAGFVPSTQLQANAIDQKALDQSSSSSSYLSTSFNSAYHSRAPPSIIL